MHALFRIVLWLNWLVAAAWLLRVLTWRRLLRRVPDLLLRGEQPSSHPLPCLTVIVPARNEAASIAATLESLVNSQGVRLEILAVDDRSEDRTGAIMDETARRLAPLACQGTTLRVLHIAELPSGWLGKTHAMALAARQTAGEWLLFTDGDVLFHPDALRRALEFAVTDHADHFVLMPTLLMESWGERMMLSFLNVVTVWAVRLWRVPDPRSLRDAVGVGAFNLIRREVYDALGGWEAFRMEVVEDLALGLAVKKRGFAQRVAFGRGLIRVRWAEGAFGVMGNLSKNLFAFFRYRPELLLSFLPVFALFTLFPLAAAAAGPAALAASCITVFAIWLDYLRQAKYQPFSAWQTLLYPAASALMLYTMFRSMAVVLWRGGVCWRGTFYPLNDLRRQAGERG